MFYLSCVRVQAVMRRFISLDVIRHLSFLLPFTLLISAILPAICFSQQTTVSPSQLSAEEQEQLQSFFNRVAQQMPESTPPTQTTINPTLVRRQPNQNSANTARNANNQSSTNTASAHRYFAITAEVGIPGGIGINGQVNPVRWFQIYLGATHNLANFGIRGGFNLFPFQWVLRVGFNGDVGQAFEGDALPILRWFLQNPNYQMPLLRRVSYTYAGANIIVDFGSDRVRGFIAGGLNYVRSQLNGYQEFLRNTSGDQSIVAEDPVIHGFIPGARTGLTVYF